MAYSDDYQGMDRARRRYEKERHNRETQAERVARQNANPLPDPNPALDSRESLKRHDDPERRHRAALAAVAAVLPTFQQFAATFHCELILEPDRLTLIGPEGCFLAVSAANDILRFDMTARGHNFVTLMGDRPQGNDYRATVMEWAHQAKIKPTQDK